MEPPAPARIMGLDVGDNRIGIAISDPLGYTAQPLLTLQRTSLRADLKSISRLIRKHGVSEVVVGNPLYMSGELSPQATKAQAVAEALRQHLAATKEGQTFPIPPIHLWDERLSTTKAHRHLSDLGHARGRTGRIERRNIIDQVAAVLILQAFIDSRDVPPR